jgi:hypothetical protein
MATEETKKYWMKFDAKREKVRQIRIRPEEFSGLTTAFAQGDGYEISSSPGEFAVPEVVIFICKTDESKKIAALISEPSGRYHYICEEVSSLSLSSKPAQQPA